MTKLSEILPQVSETSAPLPPAKEGLSQTSMASGATVHISVTPSVRSWTPSLVVSPGEPDVAALESQAQQMPPQTRFRQTRRALSEILIHFCSSPTALLDEPLPLEQTDWSQSKVLDLGPIDALNFFCKQQQVRRQGHQQEDPGSPRPALRPRPQGPSTVVPELRDRRYYPILRLQEARAQRSPMKLRGLTVLLAPRSDAVPAPAGPHPGQFHPDPEAAAATSGTAAFPPRLAQACPSTALTAPAASPAALLPAR